jgi:hypothetical protein
MPPLPVRRLRPQESPAQHERREEQEEEISFHPTFPFLAFLTATVYPTLLQF